MIKEDKFCPVTFNSFWTKSTASLGPKTWKGRMKLIIKDEERQSKKAKIPSCVEMSTIKLPTGYNTGTWEAYPPEAITTKYDEVLSAREVKRMNFRGSNNTHLHFMHSQRQQFTMHCIQSTKHFNKMKGQKRQLLVITFVNEKSQKMRNILISLPSVSPMLGGRNVISSWYVRSGAEYVVQWGWFGEFTAVC